MKSTEIKIHPRPSSSFSKRPFIFQLPRPQQGHTAFTHNIYSCKPNHLSVYLNQLTSHSMFQESAVSREITASSARKLQPPSFNPNFQFKGSVWFPPSLHPQAEKRESNLTQLCLCRALTKLWKVISE